MNYRELGKSGIKVSEIGLGCEHLQGKDTAIVCSVVDAALEKGINILDIFMSEPQVRSDLGKALIGRRDQVILQGHIGSVWKDGQYGRSRELEECKFFFQDLLTRLQTNYIDIGMLHFIDEEADLLQVIDSGILDYACELKKRGIIHAVGMSSHNPTTARKAVETGKIDVLMFSINPAYDLLPDTIDIDHLFMEETYKKEGLTGIHPAREQLYRTCEQYGTGITVMKSLAAGALLDSKQSPFGIALTPSQCIHYSLTRPAVSSVLVGCQTAEEVERAVAYEHASEEEKDYSVALSCTPKYSLKGKCMYCNHCLPCPNAIDIAQVNKYLDLASTADSVPATVREHYLALNTHASDCIQCGQCETRCPFQVPVRDRMEKANTLFGI